MHIVREFVLDIKQILDGWLKKKKYTKTNSRSSRAVNATVFLGFIYIGTGRAFLEFGMGRLSEKELGALLLISSFFQVLSALILTLE